MAASKYADGSLERDFVHGCHILHQQGVLDAFGHLSYRHPHRADVYVMSRNMAPGTVSKLSDLVEYRVADAEPVKPDSPRGYLERYIHSEVYKAHPTVQAVVHSHAENVIPYTFNGVPFRACYHMGGFIGTSVPVWDIADVYESTETRDMLVKTAIQGAALAADFRKPQSGALHGMVLMRGHGMTVISETTLQQVVVRSVYAMKNAGILTAGLTGRAAYYNGASALTAPSPHYLSDAECEGARAMLEGSADRSWGLYLKEVEMSPLYTNDV